MNHGTCINCWWYEVVKNAYYAHTKLGLELKCGNGKCYMHVSNTEPYSKVEGNSYCPDYLNRKRGNKEQKKTLDEWVEQLKKLKEG